MLKTYKFEEIHPAFDTKNKAQFLTENEAIEYLNENHDNNEGTRVYETPTHYWMDYSDNEEIDTLEDDDILKVMEENELYGIICGDKIYTDLDLTLHPDEI